MLYDLRETSAVLFQNLAAHGRYLTDMVGRKSGTNGEAVLLSLEDISLPASLGKIAVIPRPYHASLHFARGEFILLDDTGLDPAPMIAGLFLNGLTPLVLKTLRISELQRNHSESVTEAIPRNILYPEMQHFLKELGWLGQGLVKYSGQLLSRGQVAEAFVPKQLMFS